MYNPISTYRIQFNSEFKFSDFEQIMPYIEDLGIKTLYASPIFKAVPGSNHGYDVLHPHEINPEIGTLSELNSLSKQLGKKGIGWLQDIVPNHMAFHSDNQWLMDVLRNGKKSEYAAYFDTGFADAWFEGKLMVPFLGDPLGDVIEKGELKLIQREDGLHFSYFGSNYPLSYSSAKMITRSDDLKDKSLIRQLADKQEYRLCSWKETDQQINFRRFFTVNSLICLNIHDPKVFAGYHTLIGSLVSAGTINGVRVDHIDGLYDPSTYLQSLRSLIGNGTFLSVEKILEPGEPLPESWPVQGTTGYDFLGQVNNLFTYSGSRRKIERFYKELSGDSTPVHEAIFEKKRLILKRYMQGELDNLYRLFLSTAASVDRTQNISPSAMKLAIGEFLVRMPWYRFYGNSMPLPNHESSAISTIFEDILQDLASHTDSSVSQAELTAAVSSLKQLLLESFTARQDAGSTAKAKKAIDFYQRCMQFSGPLMAKGVEDTLMYSNAKFIAHNEVGDSPESYGISADEFHKLMIERQQKWPLSMNATSTHDTKRGEDARARLNIISCLPDEWMSKVKQWQEMNVHLTSNFINISAPTRNSQLATDNSIFYFIYQTLLAAYPMPGEDQSNLEERLHAYFQKAAREAKTHTDWSDPNEEYESSVRSFVSGLLDPSHTFLKDFEEFQARVADLGISNSLAQVLLKFTCPGVPDVYQGCERWDLSLVDPDNRRPVDYDMLQQWQKEIKAAEAKPEAMIQSLWENRFNGKIKFWLTQVLLQQRKSDPDFFEQAEYVPLKLSGKYKEHFLAFARRLGRKWCFTAVPLFPGAKPSESNEFWWKADWRDTRIELPGEMPYSWENVLTKNNHRLENSIPVSELFGDLPIACLKTIDEVKPNKRSAGILMAISSLPSAFGIGDLGPEAHLFANFLSRTQQRYWQVLPLNPTSSQNGNSPYSSNSAMAGNTLLISPELLLSKGLLTVSQLGRFRSESTSLTDYDAAQKTKRSLLDLAWKAYRKRYPDIDSDAEFADFCTKEDYWLKDYALFLSIKKGHRDKPWYKWPDEYRKRQKPALKKFAESHHEEVLRVKWEQYLFLEQWKDLRDHCASLGINMFGDLPFYVNHDSADVWANPDIFALKSDGSIIGVAGVPPDYFNSDGQLWGMPVFRWDVLKAQNYKWWVERIRKNMQLFDYLRLDHFRAFESYWDVPAGEKTAINGTWKPGPGKELFRILEEELGKIPFIAEDLGDVDQPVYDLRDELRLPGMKVLQFGFGDDVSESPFAPHNFSENFVAYTGTHDNNTTRGWLKQDDPQGAKRLGRYLGLRVSAAEVHRTMIRLCFASVADTAIIPIQDLLGLDESSRMNTPSTSTGNWEWRLLPGQIRKEDEQFLREITGLYNRR